jgi:hypothetical protein
LVKFQEKRGKKRTIEKKRTKEDNRNKEDKLVCLYMPKITFIHREISASGPTHLLFDTPHPPDFVWGEKVPPILFDTSEYIYWFTKTVITLSKIGHFHPDFYTRVHRGPPIPPLCPNSFLSAQGVTHRHYGKCLNSENLKKSECCHISHVVFKKVYLILLPSWYFQVK